MPVFGFYLQPAVGGRVLSYEFWRRFCDISQVVAIKVAPFHRYQTLDVVRALLDSGRAGQISLYTGNDDNILVDLATPFRFGEQQIRFAGGLLGHWAVWTEASLRLFRSVQAGLLVEDLLERNAQVTDMNAALFDVANGFAGCIAGIHEVLRRQGLLEGIWCLDREEGLSRGQAAELDRVCRLYGHLTDDEFVRNKKKDWLA
jgi:dihydrodipicolinate synthase/N-acetylneuraminate lyase